MNRLEDIGFYTLSDKRAQTTSPTSPMQRCELLITDRCNFKCPYCRGVRKEYQGDLSLQQIRNIIDLWTKDDVKNIRFSGGEPTLHPNLLETIQYAKQKGIKRIALSTNGSASFETYQELVQAGLNDISISLDACCTEDTQKMNGTSKSDYHKLLTDNIRRLSQLVYVTVGIVLTSENIDQAADTIRFAHDLGVADIRVIPAAQYSTTLNSWLASIDYPQHPILSYRLNNLRAKRPVRGLYSTDTHRCWLAQDDSMIAGDYHFPCIIHFREGGKPIGKVSKDMRAERCEWLQNHDTHNNPICKSNCLDVCVKYNNTVERLKV